MKTTQLLKTMLSALVLAMSLVACQQSKEPKKATPNLTEQERAEELRKVEESLQMRMGLKQNVFVEQKKFELVFVSETKIAARILLELNQQPQVFVFSMPLQGTGEQLEIQDKTDELTEKFPSQNLEISAYKFKSGTIDMVAFEYRFLKVTKHTSESGSKFVLVILNKSLGDKAIIKTQYEYPTKTDLKTWALSANVSAMTAD